MLPPSFKKEEYWSEDGCKYEALILIKKILTFMGHYSISFCDHAFWL